MNKEDALLLGCLWDPTFHQRPGSTLQLHAHWPDPSTDTHIMQVGERSRLPRRRLLRTERIPKERHLWPDEGKVRGTNS